MLVKEMEVARKRNLIVDKFYPALMEATISIDEARMLLQAITSSIMEEVLQTMSERKFDEIYNKVVKKLTPNDERLLKIEALLQTVRNENLYVAREIVEGMIRAIEQMISDELKGRTLDTLLADWDKMLYQK